MEVEQRFLPRRLDVAGIARRLWLESLKPGPQCRRAPPGSLHWWCPQVGSLSSFISFYVSCFVYIFPFINKNKIKYMNMQVYRARARSPMRMPTGEGTEVGGVSANSVGDRGDYDPGYAKRANMWALVLIHNSFHFFNSCKARYSLIHLYASIPASTSVRVHDKQGGVMESSSATSRRPTLSHRWGPSRGFGPLRAARLACAGTYTCNATSTSLHLHGNEGGVEECP